MNSQDSSLLRTHVILLVEDNPGDVRLVMEALSSATARHKITTVGTGADAVAFLQRSGEYADAVRPDLILLDLNLPKISGSEVLSLIKKDPRLKRIPVVVLTGSRSEEDIARSYELHANCYVTKPLDLEKFIHIVKNIQEFWLSTAELPKE